MVATHLVRSLGCLLLATLGVAAPSPYLLREVSPEEVDLSPRSGLVKRAPTCNTPTNRACWTTGFNINTDYEANFPATGVIRNVSSQVSQECSYRLTGNKYNFVITEEDNWTDGADGVPKKKAMLINGGPFCDSHLN